MPELFTVVYNYARANRSIIQSSWSELV